MGEVEIKRGVAFMNNPRSTRYAVASWTQTQKVDFLRGKMSPADLEEVLKRTGGAQSDDLTQFFEMETKPAAPVPAPVTKTDPAPKSSGYGVYGLVGAGLLGALTSALFFVIAM